MSINNPVTGSIARAARVIDVLAHANNGAGLTEIMTQSEFSKTTTFRVLAALQNVKYVFQDPENREYRLGHKFTELARTAARAHIAVSCATSRSIKPAHPTARETPERDVHDHPHA